MFHARAALDAVSRTTLGDYTGKVPLDAPGAIDLELVIDGDELGDVDLQRALGGAIAAAGAGDVDVGAVK